MNWKKWDDNTWINMSNGHTLEVHEYSNGNNVLMFCVVYKLAGTHKWERDKDFDSKEKAVAFIEELIK